MDNDKDLNSIECLDLMNLEAGWQIVKVNGVDLPFWGQAAFTQCKNDFSLLLLKERRCFVIHIVTTDP